jgi:hypothetical protein
VVIPTGALLARWTWRHIRTQMQITMYNRKTTTAITRTLKRNALTSVLSNFRSTSSLETKTIQCLLRFFNGTQIRTERWQFRFLPNLYGRFVSVLNSATPRSATPLVNWMTTDHPVVVQIIFRFFLHQANLASQCSTTQRKVQEQNDEKHFFGLEMLAPTALQYFLLVCYLPLHLVGHETQQQMSVRSCCHF